MPACLLPSFTRDRHSSGSWPPPGVSSLVSIDRFCCSCSSAIIDPFLAKPLTKPLLGPPHEPLPATARVAGWLAGRSTDWTPDVGCSSPLTEQLLPLSATVHGLNSISEACAACARVVHACREQTSIFPNTDLHVLSSRTFESAHPSHRWSIGLTSRHWLGRRSSQRRPPFF